MVFKQLYDLNVADEEFIPYGGMGEDRFLGGVADKYKVQGYDPARAKALFFDIYINTFAKPEQNIGFPGEYAACTRLHCSLLAAALEVTWLLAFLT
jgi:hypothetical protein